MKIDPAGRFSSGVVKELHELVMDAKNSDRIFVDIPIGLPNGPPESLERQCDKEARKFVVSRRSSVFPAPARTAISASLSYEEAAAVNKKALGKGLTKQAFAIFAKIRQVDELIRRDGRAGHIVREVHPEVCFRALSGAALKDSKKTHNGYLERLSLLNAASPSAKQFAMATRICDRFSSDVAVDDVLDAMVAALTATVEDSALKTLPSNPPKDACGLPMQMVYATREDVDV